MHNIYAPGGMKWFADFQIIQSLTQNLAVPETTFPDMDQYQEEEKTMSSVVKEVFFYFFFNCTTVL